MKSNLKAEKSSIVVASSESTIGLDLGDRWSRYCILDSAGAIANEDRVRTTPEALEKCFGNIPATRIVIEAGTHSPWVSRLLEKLGHQVIVANARRVRLINESDRKNDRVDARMLAKLGRVDVSLLAPVQPIHTDFILNHWNIACDVSRPTVTYLMKKVTSSGQAFRLVFPSRFAGSVGLPSR